jgi:hypothetical protein
MGCAESKQNTQPKGQPAASSNEASARGAPAVATASVKSPQPQPISSGPADTTAGKAESGKSKKATSTAGSHRATNTDFVFYADAASETAAASIRSSSGGLVGMEPLSGSGRGESVTFIDDANGSRRSGRSGSVTESASPSSAPMLLRIVLTGGPCAGKSTAMSIIQQRLGQMDKVRVFCVPEAATLMVAAGHQWVELNRERIIEFQLALLRLQLCIEDQLCAIARATGKPSVVLCDRGAMDGRAFCSPEDFDELLKRGGYTLERLRDRYDAIIHLVTCAIGAEAHYNLDNPARTETPAEAAQTCTRLRSCYLGHPQLRIIDNSTDFNGKVDRCVKFIKTLLGSTDEESGMKRKFLLPQPPESYPPDLQTVSCVVTLNILSEPLKTGFSMLIKRQQGKSIVLMHHRSTKDSKGVRTNYETRITSREYAHLFALRDPTKDEIVKKNECFIYKEHFFEVGTVVTPERLKGLSLAYISVASPQEVVELPEFMKDAKEVTGVAQYDTAVFATPSAVSKSPSQSAVESW